VLFAIFLFFCCTKDAGHDDAFQKCKFCNNIGASIGCNVKSCRITFHFPCGIANGVLAQYYGIFRYFCLVCCLLFIVRQMQDNFRVKGNKLYFGFVDLEKAFDRVLRKVIRWAMCKLGVEEWLVSAFKSMYTGAKTVARTIYGNSNGFEVKVVMHQDSAFSPSLFVIVMEALFREFRVALSGELLYAEDLVVIAETEDDLIKRRNNTHTHTQPFYCSSGICLGPPG